MRRTRQAPVHEATPPRGSLRLLADPVVGPFFFGKLLSTAGVWIYNVTSVIVVFQLTGSAVLVGAVSVAQFIPQLVLTPWSGALADRGDRRRQLVAGRVVTGAGSGGLVLWISVAGLAGAGGAYAVILSALVLGVGFALGGPAMESVVPSMVRPSEVAAVVALNSVPLTLGRSAGPLLGALIAIVSGPLAAFAVVAATQLAFAAVLAVVIHDSERIRPRDVSIRGGLHYLRQDRALRPLLMGVAAVGLGADPAITLAPSIADGLGGNAGLVGGLASAFGVGAASAFLVLGRLQRRFSLPHLAGTGLLLSATGLTGLASSQQPGFALGFLGVAGIGLTISLTSFTTMIQHRSPEQLRGRIMALWAMAFLGCRPLAAAVNGGVTEYAFLELALLLDAAVLLATAWIARPSRIDPPAPSAHSGHSKMPRFRVTARSLPEQM